MALIPAGASNAGADPAFPRSVGLFGSGPVRMQSVEGNVV
jgi:hypothetical protein